MTEPISATVATEAENETENPFNPVLSTLDLIGAVGNVFADPISLSIDTNDSSAADVNLEAEREAEREREKEEEREREWERQREQYRELERERER